MKKSVPAKKQNELNQEVGEIKFREFPKNDFRPITRRYTLESNLDRKAISQLEGKYTPLIKQAQLIEQKAGDAELRARQEVERSRGSLEEAQRLAVNAKEIEEKAKANLKNVIIELDKVNKEKEKSKAKQITAERTRLVEEKKLARKLVLDQATRKAIAEAKLRTQLKYENLEDSKKIKIEAALRMLDEIAEEEYQLSSPISHENSVKMDEALAILKSVEERVNEKEAKRRAKEELRLAQALEKEAKAKVLEALEKDPYFAEINPKFIDANGDIVSDDVMRRTIEEQITLALDHEYYERIEFLQNSERAAISAEIVSKEKVRAAKDALNKAEMIFKSNNLAEKEATRQHEMAIERTQAVFKEFEAEKTRLVNLERERLEIERLERARIEKLEREQFVRDQNHEIEMLENARKQAERISRKREALARLKNIVHEEQGKVDAGFYSANTPNLASAIELVKTVDSLEDISDNVKQKIIDRKQNEKDLAKTKKQIRNITQRENVLSPEILENVAHKVAITAADKLKISDNDIAREANILEKKAEKRARDLNAKNSKKANSSKTKNKK